MAIDGGIAQYLENAGPVNHARGLRRLFDKALMGMDVRAAGGLASSGAQNGGVTRGYDLAVVQRGAGANMSVDVGYGGCFVGGTVAAHQGTYFVFNDAAANVLITTANATNPRIDVIGVRVQDQEHGDGSDAATLVAIAGTPAPSPAVPTLPANFLTLAHVAVAANAPSITTPNITDQRWRAVANGGMQPATAARHSINPTEPILSYETDTDYATVWDGSAHQPLGQSARAWTVIQDILRATDGAISFTSIPQTFTHLRLVGAARSTHAATSIESLLMRVNNDSSAIYNYEELGAQTASVASATSSNQTSGRIGFTIGASGTASVFASIEVLFSCYRSASMHKLWKGQGGDSANLSTVSGRWASTAAITRIDLLDSALGTAFLTGSNVTLLGIR